MLHLNETLKIHILEKKYSCRYPRKYRLNIKFTQSSISEISEKNKNVKTENMV